MTFLVDTEPLDAEGAERQASYSARLLRFPFDHTSAQSLGEARQTRSASADVSQQPFDLTVIVPIYNTRRYAVDALRSVLLAAGQIRIQIICVNDGSTDDSLQLVADFLRAQNCKSALIIDQPNRGPGAARNVALPFVWGEYLASLDSDDLVDPPGYATLLAFAREHECDVVWGRLKNFWDDLDRTEGYFDASVWESMLGGRDAIVVSPRLDHRPFAIQPNASHRIVRTAFLRDHQILYPHHFLSEDVPVLVKLLCHARRAGFVDVPVCYYRLGRPGKLTSRRDDSWLDMIAMFRESWEALLKSSCSSDHGASFLFLASSFIIWGGRALPLDARRQFFARFCTEFKCVPKSWIEAFFKRSRDFDLSFVTWCLAHGEAEGLLQRSANGRTPWISVRFLCQVYGAREVMFSMKQRLRRLLNVGVS